MRYAASTLFLAVLALAAAPAANGQAPVVPTAPPQHVTVPSLPGQPNREATVTPSGSLQTDSEGYAVTNRLDASGQLPTGTPPPAGVAPQGTAAPKKAKGASASVQAVPNVPAGPAPTGPAVVTGANVVRIRGMVKAIEPGKSLTMTVRGSGRDVTYTLKSGASVPPGLKVGDSVRLTVLAAEKGKVASKVEVLPPATPTSPAR